MSEQQPRRLSLLPSDSFPRRHIGPDDAAIQEMLRALGVDSLEALIGEIVPQDILRSDLLELPAARTEHALIGELRARAAANRVLRSYIGMGYHDCITPPVIQRNILENPGWYTQYTPYQAEIAQGRLEALLNFQTHGGRPDRAAARQRLAARRGDRGGRGDAHVPRARQARSTPLLRRRGLPPPDRRGRGDPGRASGIELEVGPVEELDLDAGGYFGVLLQYPTTDGRVRDETDLIARAQASGALVVVAADPLALTLLRPPGELGADICVGSTQRFGVPLGFGGPHAAFLSTREEHRRLIPGRLVGVSRDAHDRPAFRLALQTREQHIRRDKATSNICTAQVLLAVMAGMYAVYHGPEGLRRIARRVHLLAAVLAEGLRRLGQDVGEEPFFDTLTLRVDRALGDKFMLRALERGINLRPYEDGPVGIALDETTTAGDVAELLEIFSEHGPSTLSVDELAAEVDPELPAPLRRTSEFLKHPVFNEHHSEHEMLRYIRRLESRDLSLTTSMIPLGSCTMKLNATSEMLPVSWPELARLHPFAPGTSPPDTNSCSRISGSGWPRSPACPASRCSRTRGPRGSSPGCCRSGRIT